MFTIFPSPSPELPVLAASQLLRELDAGAALLLLLELVFVVAASVFPSSRLDFVRFVALSAASS